MQAQAFLGPHDAAERQYIFAARDRMDETYDTIRAVRGARGCRKKNGLRISTPWWLH
jgi:hypothetical protein